MECISGWGEFVFTPLVNEPRCAVYTAPATALGTESQA